MNEKGEKTMKIKSILLLLIMLWIPAQGIAGEKHVILTSAEFPPYCGEQLESPGVVVEVIVEAYKRVGYTVEIQYRPWKRALEEAKEGAYDGTFTLWHTTEREQWFLFSESLEVPNQISLLKRKGEDIPFNTLEDLKPYTIGIVRGYANPPEFENATYLQKEEVKEDVFNLKKLLGKRIDLVLIDKGVGMFLMKNQFPESQDAVEWLEPPLQVIPQYLGISKKTADSQQKLDDFNLGLKRISEDGTLQKILSSYGFE
jgi:polar amino acid transport system substrate-binding protein